LSILGKMTVGITLTVAAALAFVKSRKRTLAAGTTLLPLLAVSPAPAHALPTRQDVVDGATKVQDMLKMPPSDVAASFQSLNFDSVLQEVLTRVETVVNLPSGVDLPSSPLNMDSIFAALWGLGLDGMLESITSALRAEPEQLAIAAQELQNQIVGMLTISTPDTIPGFLQPAVDHPTVWAVSWAVTTTLFVSAITPEEKVYGDDSLPMRYDLEQISQYYSRRPFERASRTFTILSKFGRWAVGYYTDKVTGNETRNERMRAKQMVDIISDLGPAFIKIGQAVSMRPDLLSPGYLEALQQLQDRVPPFDDQLAADIVTRSFPPGTNLAKLFKYGRSAITKPVAAASIGQVYKVELAEGGTVALKVQRPGLLRQVSLDLYIVRQLLDLAAKAGKGNKQFSDSCISTIGVIDEWANRFIQELDYRQEALNQQRFDESMSRNSFLQNTLCVPKVYEEYTSQSTLMTEWVEGVRLSDVAYGSPEGRKTISQLLSAYLVQLLETGFMHADPHLGNFLRTPDGKLCVLDYGLMTDITEDQRYGILEYIAHLSAKDYDATLTDLIGLGFIPPEMDEDPQKRAIVAPLLGQVLGELQKGGGAGAINIEQVTAQIQQLGQEYPLLIPPYFGLIIRTFSSLEGAGLSSDSSYAIVDECFPYMAHRLLTDDSPRMRLVLKTWLYGNADQLMVERVEEVVEGFQRFAQNIPRPPPTPITVQGEVIETEKREELDPLTRDAVLLLLAPNGNYVQDLVVDELVRIIDSSSRNMLLMLWKRIYLQADGAMKDDSLFGRLRNANPVSPIVWSTVTRLAEQNVALLKLSPEDQHSVDVAERLLQLIEPAVQPPEGGLQSLITREQLQSTAQQVQLWSPLAVQVLPGVQRMTQRAALKLLAQLTLRLAEVMGNTPDVNSDTRNPQAASAQ